MKETALKLLEVCCRGLARMSRTKRDRGQQTASADDIITAPWYVQGIVTEWIISYSFVLSYS